MNRRPLVRACADTYPALLHEAKADLAQLHFEHRCRMADLERALAETRQELEDLRDIVRRRMAAERELAELYRERDIERAKRAERDLALPLQ